MTDRCAAAGTALLLLVAVIATAGAVRAADPAQPRRLVLATTTSVRDSGLMDALLPAFEAESGFEVELIAVGSGAALRLGALGEADVVVAHAPEEEQKLVASGQLVERRPFVHGYFLLAGPAEDPVGVAGAASATEAVRRIAAAPAPWASRGDESGTHGREQALLRAAGRDPATRWQGFLSTGSGMGQTLMVAGEKRAYVLTDRATFEAFRARTALAPLYARPDAALLNEYSVLRPNPEALEPGRVDVRGARRFADFLLSPATQRRIGDFGRTAEGAPLFTPGPAPPELR
ncbi:substrate-binding domain-containing protein [Myxococcota bacterium]|nr:substrate-binding domain-containing protein [Myxococcota bacterium]MCZ7617830.1 substrate-binding domain-containing protein [Myxococcota bacterium]